MKWILLFQGFCWLRILLRYEDEVDNVFVGVVFWRRKREKDEREGVNMNMNMMALFLGLRWFVFSAS